MLEELLRLKITEEDVANAVCGSVTRCVIAQAVRRQFPQATFVQVYPNQITITEDGHYHHYAMPSNGLNIVAETDAGDFKLRKSRFLKLQLLNIKPVQVATPEQKQRATAKKARYNAKHAGHKNPNTRLMAAKRAGVAGKKLGPVSIP